MGRRQPYLSADIMVRRLPESRRRRMARLRAAALVVIAAVAVTGVTLQELGESERKAGVDVALASPGPFDLFPG